MFYEANLSIACVDGALEAIISSDAQRILQFLKQRDHEGSSLTLLVRKTPDSELLELYNEQVYPYLKAEADEVDKS